MPLFFIKPYTLLFFTTLMVGILITLSSTNWLMIWMGLELTLYSFIPILLQTTFNQEKEAAVKYFLTQALASGLLLLGILVTNISPYLMILPLFALAMKLGLAPFHFWLPSVMISMPWSMCWLLSTILKIGPMFLFIMMIEASFQPVIAAISAISVLVGGIGGLNQTQIRPLLAYSSISHMGWTIACAIVSPTMAMFYFTAYIFMVSAIMMTLNSMHSFILSSSMNLLNAPKHLQLSFIISMLSLSGLPPLFGFFPKLMVLLTLIQSNMTMLTIFLIIGATINLFYYLKLLTSIFFSSSPKLPIYSISPKSNILGPFMTSLASITAIVILSLYMF
uniref:NADH-ubiquinone oxidoreductase chain 2 n=1 Tax=Melinna cristata TaxID=222004 RepID=A0A8A4VPV6_9ANNE|nr:NADH dehydrogenase subunit 2 [Melinna cristata]QTD82978.1 NADH dehydrogenase subunit 2 [Melinna cristata]